MRPLHIIAAIIFLISLLSASLLCAQPQIVLPDPLGAPASSSVDLPVTFTSGGADVAGVSFSLDFDESCLGFDPTDSDSDGIPDAVSVEVPGDFDVFVFYDSGDTDGEIDVAVADLVPPVTTLPDGPLVAVSLTTCSTLGNSAVSFSATPSPTFSDPETVDVVGSSVDGGVLIKVPATVVRIESAAETDDGVVDECEEAHDRATELRVVFSEEMALAGAGSALDPANYLIVNAGPDRDLSTTECNLAGDDEALVPDAVAWDDAGDSAILTFETYLPNGPTRLLACGSLTDRFGLALDGSGDGAPAGDFARTFRAETTNAALNGQMDCGLEDWLLFTSVPGEIFFEASVDVDGAEVSGSALIDLSAGGFASMGQCIDDVFAVSYAMSAAGELLSPAASVEIELFCRVFDQQDCMGRLLSNSSSSSVLSAGGFSEFTHGDVLSPEARSMQCGFSLEETGGATFDARLDALVVDLAEILLVDGFESGDTSAWSAVVIP